MFMLIVLLLFLFNNIEPKIELKLKTLLSLMMTSGLLAGYLCVYHILSNSIFPHMCLCFTEAAGVVRRMVSIDVVPTLEWI